MKIKIGKKFRIKGYNHRLNGLVATIKSIDGEYIYVKPRYKRYEVELYRCELEEV